MIGTIIAKGADQDPDLAVVKVSTPHIPPVHLEIGDLREGDPIADAGYPASQMTLAEITGSIVPSVHLGTIAALENRGALVEYDAQTLPGNSGGPLFDPRSGGVVGIVDAKLKAYNEANLGIGIGRVVAPFLTAHQIPYTSYRSAANEVASSGSAPSADLATIRSLPGAGVVAIIYDTSQATGAVAGPGVANAARDFAQKLASQFKVSTVLVDLHVATKADVLNAIHGNNALIGFVYNASFRNTQFYSNAYGTSTTWAFGLGASMVDAFGTDWVGTGTIAKTVHSNRADMQNIIESSLADLNDQVIRKIDDAVFKDDEDVVTNFFRYALPLRTGSKRAFFFLTSSPDGARASVVGDFTPAAQAGLQNGDLVTKLNGNSLVGLSQEVIGKLLSGIMSSNENYDLVVRTADGKDEHISFEAEDLRWYVDHRVETTSP